MPQPRLLVVVVVAAVAAAVFVATGLACTPASSAAVESPAQPTPAHAVPSPEPAPMFSAHGAVVIDAPGGPARFTVELAIKDAERQRGLMFREHLDDDAGMLFLFEKQRPLSFWMKNTHIPLDMIFIDEGGTIAGIVEDAEPLTLVSRKVDAPSRYVLEVNAGTARKRGFAPGQRVHFEQVPRDLVDPRALQ